MLGSTFVEHYRSHFTTCNQLASQKGLKFCTNKIQCTVQHLEKAKLRWPDQHELWKMIEHRVAMYFYCDKNRTIMIDISEDKLNSLFPSVHDVELEAFEECEDCNVVRCAVSGRVSMFIHHQFLCVRRNRIAYDRIVLRRNDELVPLFHSEVMKNVGHLARQCSHNITEGDSCDEINSKLKEQGEDWTLTKWAHRNAHTIVDELTSTNNMTTVSTLKKIVREFDNEAGKRARLYTMTADVVLAFVKVIHGDEVNQRPLVYQIHVPVPASQSSKVDLCSGVFVTNHRHSSLAVFGWELKTRQLKGHALFNCMEFIAMHRGLTFDEDMAYSSLCKRVSSGVTSVNKIAGLEDSIMIDVTDERIVAADKKAMRQVTDTMVYELEYALTNWRVRFVLRSDILSIAYKVARRDMGVSQLTKLLLQKAAHGVTAAVDEGDEMDI